MSNDETIEFVQKINFDFDNHFGLYAVESKLTKELLVHGICDSGI